MSAVTIFKNIQGEWIFEKLLQHLDMTEEEFAAEYEEKLKKDPTCLNETVVEMMSQIIRRGREKCSN